MRLHPVQQLAEKHDFVPRIAGFSVYMAFIAVLEVLRLFPATAQLLTPEVLSLLYPVQIGCTALALGLFYRHCCEVHWADLKNAGHTLLSLALAVVVFVLWINLTQSWATMGEPGSGFTPDSLPEGGARALLLCVRFAGAALVVPVMEELFWRSFLIRYLQHTDFTKVRMGSITPLAFWGTAFLFGLEHHLVVAGIIAGIAYNIVYWRTRSVAQCIFSHAVTNALLGIYVLQTESWHLW